MNTQKMRLIFCLAIPLLVGAISAFVTRRSMEAFAQLAQPPLSPPGWMFPVVWTILYVLMGFASWWVLSQPESPERYRAWRLYLLQLGVNFFWSVFFFNLAWHEFAFLWLVILWSLIVLTTVAFHRVEKIAARLMLPYLIWVAFAGYLNLGVAVLN